MSLDDLASDAEERFREAALRNREFEARHARLIACGRCHFCDEAVHAGALFCRPDAGGSCRDDFEALKAAQRRNGV
jgi:hypothetical protein